MTDERFADEGSADEPREGAFDGLDLGVLAEGAHPTARQWEAIATDASHRRHRRTWLIAAAALVVLVVGTAGVLLGREGDDTVGFATGGLATGAYIVPPDGSTDVNIEWSGASYMIHYVTDGTPWILRVMAEADPFLPSDRSTVDDLRESADQVGARMIEDPDLGTVFFACSGRRTAGLSVPTDGTMVPDTGVPDTAVVSEFGPMTAAWTVGRGLAILIPAEMNEAPCHSPDGPPAETADAVGRLRVVDAVGFQRFLDGVDGGSPVTTLQQEVVVPAPPTATTLPEEPPADRGTAEEQIAAAVAGFSDEAADGTFPNLEDGVAKAAEYREAFDLARRQSGAAQVGDGTGSGDEATLSRLRFATPERADITISFESTLPSGTFTFDQQGEAILQDGRWVITYRTVITTLGRACVPPGGYDGC